ncbi:hypothetical protein EZL74_08505 [Flavobacterium silvisoli]|uniref:AAA+ ATPase domain-containing protein n=1 Tax=Flavobacterium silvisoli TaxID=2529433 RepID=A0A4Q9YXJ1_9FLAO|nr:AAA domain-containing protein [Flavobacterium silvisoli]TBX68342.1 hypothetical protein EZL74_08505 [Flavobacterium silvisoli]
MKIKNIQQYRTFYKNEIRDLPTRDENFIGNFLIDKNTKKKKFGWFEIYHGDKEGYGKAETGIENFLQSFLDMAKDGQAVYEFLQNAVDAGSTHYTMVWGQDPIDDNFYLLVANNGKMFDLNSIRSILNVGSSTKTADSQTIGKFGIGFKLAHRLVGKDNGLQELINENSGPVLFSWKNYEIEKLAAGSIPVPSDMHISNESDESVVLDENPWLFKILITCFPCLPENDLATELPIMVDGIMADKNPFDKNELEVLSRWTKSNQHILNKETYKEGSLFFIKLGSGKESELAEVNLKHGVKFSLAILKETAENESKKNKVLQTVQLNNEEPITYPNLEYLKISIDKEEEKDTYAYVRFGVEQYEELTTEQKKKIEHEANIEALFGFRKHNKIGEYFKGAPNLYLYFPLSEEVHNFNYILHSNAFYKGSSRTFLHTGSSKEDGINERLLKTIVSKIDERLSILSTSADEEDKSLFLHFYAALLTSGKSTNQSRAWIDEPYINRINELLRKYIPVRISENSNEFTVTDNPESVFIKKTKININSRDWNLENVNWFYWGDDSDLNIVLNAGNKLSIKEFSIFDLLAFEKIDESVNEWLNNEDEKRKIVLSELKYFDREITNIEKIKSQLVNLNLFEFSNRATLSLNSFVEKEREGYFLIHNKLSDIRDILLKLGVTITTLDLDEYSFVDIYRSYLLQSTKHKGYTELTQLFSNNVTDATLSRLSKVEKLAVFKAFRTLNAENVTERIKELKLFSNNSGAHVCFKNLFFQAESDNWLNNFNINSLEFDSQFKQFLLADQSELYEGIIYPFWEQIAGYIAETPLKSDEILSDCIAAYENSTWVEKSNYLVSTLKKIIFLSEVVQVNSIFFDENILSLPDEIFKRIQTTVLKFYNIHIPDKCLIPYLSLKPFGYVVSIFDPKIENTECSLEELEDLLMLSKTCNIDFFESNCIISSNGLYAIDSSGNKKQIASSKAEIKEYVKKYYPEEYVLIPDTLNDSKVKIELSDSKLIEHLIERFEEDEIQQQELDFLQVLLPERFNDKKAFLEKISSVSLDANWTEGNRNELYLQLLKDIVEGNISDDELSHLHQKIIIKKEDRVIIVGDIDSAEDSIKVLRGDKEIILSQSQILNLDNADNIKLIQEFHDEAKRRELIKQSTSDKIFKISNIGITEDLVTKFKNNLDKNRLVNSHQLIFIWLSGKFKKDEYSKFSLLSHDDQWYTVAKQLFINCSENNKHINNAYVLNECYGDLQTLLQLNKNEIYNYGIDEEDIITTNFLFTRGFKTDILESTESVGEKLNYLFSAWQSTPNVMKEEKRNQDWQPHLGIIPNQFVLNAIKTEDETLPVEFIDWYQNERKREEFLKAIGVYITDSPIEKIRKYLTLKNNDHPADIDIEKFNDVLLLNTLKGLAGDFTELNNIPVVYEEEKHKLHLLLLEKIINHLYGKSINIPTLTYCTFNTFKIVKSEEAEILKIDEVIHQKLRISNAPDLNLLYKFNNVIRITETLHSEMIDSCEEVKFIKTFIPGNTQQEHDEPFYHNWKSENNIILFKENELQFDILIEVDDKTICVGRITDGLFHLQNSLNNSIEIFYNKSVSLEELSHSLSNDYESVSNALSNLIYKRNAMLTSFYNTLNAAAKGEVNDAHLQALKMAFKEEDLKLERKELIESIKNNTNYSYNWFESYLKFLLTFESKQDTTSQQSISFQEIKRYSINDKLSNKYFMLCGASSLIPLNIEDFDDFKVTLNIKNRQNENIKVEGVSKRGQDILIYCRETIPESVIKLFNEVIQIRISFSPTMNLLQLLKNAFVNRNNIDEWEDINEILPKLNFIYGPPGTGKTTTICNKIIDGVKENYNSKYLLLTPTNKAADVLCKKILDTPFEVEGASEEKELEIENHGRSITLTRIGKPTDPELEDIEEGIYQNSLTTAQLDYTNLVASTIHRIPYFEVVDEVEKENIKLFKLADHWDYVIFDEASMINLPYLVFAILAIHKFSPNATFVIAGDPKQIPPVVDVTDKDLEELDIQDENVYTMMNISSFKKDEQKLRIGDTINNLDRQYRSIKEIGQLFSELSYDHLLKHDREINNKNTKKLPVAFSELIQNNVTFIDVPLDAENAIYRVNKLLYSPYHTYSAIFVVELIKYFDALISKDETWTIGLIAPYKAQSVLLNKLITSYGISEKLKIYSDTVHGFQGDECDIIFFICNPNSTTYTGNKRALLSKEYIYNVAISRAKDYLIILHPFSVIPDNPFINKIRNSYQSNFGNPVIRKSEEFEKVIFKQKDFIEKNSYISGHDNINIFGQMEMKYFIKTNESAIDIQLRKIDTK